jgi:hypothetical protein
MKTYDPECEYLAASFLPDGTSDRKVAELAAHIQSCIEDWLENEDDNTEAKRQDALDRAWGI